MGVAAAQGIELGAVSLAGAKRRFLERSPVCLAGFLLSTRDCEKLAKAVGRLTFVAFAWIMLHWVMQAYSS